MRRAACLSPVILFSLAAVVAAQTAPARADLSGTWRMDETRSGSPCHQDFVGPVVRVIYQTAGTLVVEHSAGSEMTRLTYPMLDARPEPASGAELANHAYWDGDRIITETVQNVQGQTVTMREIWNLAPDTDELIVERVVEVEHGYTVRGGQNHSTVQDVFVRIKPKF